MFSYLSHALALSHVRWIRYFFAGRTAVRLSVLFLPSDPMFIKSNSTFECSNGWQNLRKLVVLPCSRLLLDTLAFLIVSLLLFYMFLSAFPRKFSFEWNFNYMIVVFCTLFFYLNSAFVCGVSSILYSFVHYIYSLKYMVWSLHWLGTS